MTTIRPMSFAKMEYRYTLLLQIFICVLEKTQRYVNVVDDRIYLVHRTTRNLLPTFAMIREM